MASCVVCGNEYDKSFEVLPAGEGRGAGVRQLRVCDPPPRTDVRPLRMSDHRSWRRGRRAHVLLRELCPRGGAHQRATRTASTKSPPALRRRRRSESTIVRWLHDEADLRPSWRRVRRTPWRDPRAARVSRSHRPRPPAGHGPPRFHRRRPRLHRRRAGDEHPATGHRDGWHHRPCPGVRRSAPGLRPLRGAHGRGRRPGLGRIRKSVRHRRHARRTPSAVRARWRQLEQLPRSSGPGDGPVSHAITPDAR